MGDARTTSLSALRQAASLALLALCLVVLAACSSGGSLPFAKSTDGTPGPSGKTVPPIELVEVAGLPSAKLPALKDALAVAAGKRDMAIIDTRLDSTTMSLRGNFTIIPDPAAVRLGYSWTLTDPKGTVLHTISAEEVAPGTATGDPWLQVTPAVLQRVAAYTAESLSSRLSQLGYATEVGGMPPPLETYARAGPDADKDIDFETMYGPQGMPTVGKASPQVPAGQKTALAAAEAEPVDAAPADDQAIAAAKTARPDPSGRKRISAVVVLPVSGAPGSGNDDLTKAMRQTLKDAGWPVLMKPRDDALTISGRVKLGPKQGKSQNVALDWTIKTPDGRTLGTVKQANKVPPGSLEGGWGENALFAAQAAVTGIYDLVKKYR
ncbi:hypothetical protein [Taklimakanibacter lacteus]|uniref:hypothetical protein n=1 Tax=Taklimakanibacter lacteus TaxID=2268456 RepID=UPI000E669A42